MNLPKRSELANNWQLDDEIVFLNHGSFGATPIEILELQNSYRKEIEMDPVKFFERSYMDYYINSRNIFSEFVNANPDGMTFVNNATTGVNTVLRSLKLEKGDEILVTSHTYQACSNAVDFVTKKFNAKKVIVDIPFKVKDDKEIVDMILKSINMNTKLALIDTVTSPTGMRMPFEKLVFELQLLNIDVLLDAAHGPGIVPLDLTKLNAAYVTGNCHKWLCSPKGSGFLHIREDKISSIRPLVISHGASFDGRIGDKFAYEFGWTGTQDPTPFMCIPASIKYLEDMVDGGWPTIMKRNRELAINGRKILCDALEIEPPFPDHMVSSIASIEIGKGGNFQLFDIGEDPLHDILLDKYSIQVPVIRWKHHRTKYIRISAQLYNSLAEYKYLAMVLKECL